MFCNLAQHDEDVAKFSFTFRYVQGNCVNGHQAVFMRPVTQNDCNPGEDGDFLVFRDMVRRLCQFDKLRRLIIGVVRIISSLFVTMATVKSN